jgi:hypothetical protein
MKWGCYKGPFPSTPIYTTYLDTHWEYCLMNCSAHNGERALIKVPYEDDPRVLEIYRQYSPEVIWKEL